MRYLGIDYGTKKVGTALSDESGAMGFPHAVLPNDVRLLETLATLMEERDVAVIVLGESHNFSGTPNPVDAEAKAFGEALRARTGATLVFEPEVLTTEAARRDPEGTSDWRTPVDAQAAALILTSYLSRTHD